MGQILFVRHAVALERAEWNDLGKEDRERPLSEAGMAKFKAASLNLPLILSSIDLIYSSEYVRAYETARVLKDIYDCPLEIIADLNPGNDFTNVLETLVSSQGRTLAVVGHYPDQLELMEAFLGLETLPIQFKKGSFHLMKIDEHGERLLYWSMPRKVLGSFN